MHLRGSLAATCFFLLCLFPVVLAGCGGGGDGSGSGSQDGAGGGAKQNGEPAQKKKGAPPEIKLGLGTIARVDDEREVIILRPSADEQGNIIRFKANQNTKFTLDDKEAELADLEKGQQAQIRYISRDGRSVARDVTAFKP
jgi:hypothetical protein